MMLLPRLIKYFVLGLIFFFLIHASIIVQGYASSNLFQCMEECLRYEGGNSSTNKNICKSRCAKATIKVPIQKIPKDCMKVFKGCNISCNNDKKCKKNCKQNLMNCK